MPATAAASVSSVAVRRLQRLASAPAPRPGRGLLAAGPDRGPAVTSPDRGSGVAGTGGVPDRPPPMPPAWPWGLRDRAAAASRSTGSRSRV